MRQKSTFDIPKILKKKKVAKGFDSVNVHGPLSLTRVDTCRHVLQMHLNRFFHRASIISFVKEHGANVFYYYYYYCIIGFLIEAYSVRNTDLYSYLSQFSEEKK